MARNPKNHAPRKSPTGPRRIHYVLSAHWDREWLQPFQVFRHRLARLMDRTLADLDSGQLRGPFTTDGQAIVVEDYLEARPRQRSKVEKLARAGKLKIGPWYVLPEEWLVSGESIVRNLRLGRQVARDVGGIPSDAGFACDLFGHIGQLPQLFAGFGIKGVFLWRGIEPRPAAHFIWEGSDGTRLPTYRFGRAGYGDYAYDVRRGTQPETSFDESRSRRDHVAFIAKEARRTALPPVLVFDGCDHLEYDIDHYRVLLSLRPEDGLPGAVVHSTLDDYLRELLPHTGRITDVVAGELRACARAPLIEDQQWLIPGVLSSRVNLKHANAHCQNLLTHWAEPFALMALAFAGGEDPADFLALAWRWLLQNHPHDSIGGCSIDEVHEDMKFRFAQCRQIGERLTAEALRRLSASVGGAVGPQELRVLVANPLARDLEETVELALQIPAEWPCFNEQFGFEPKPAFCIRGAAGEEITYQRLAQDPNRTKYRAAHPLKFPVPYKTNDVTVALRLRIPALGYTTLTLRAGEMTRTDGIIPAFASPTRSLEVPGLATSECAMENEQLAVTIETNGTLTLTDKRTGATYRRLLTFEDCADIGDGWYHGQTVNDQTFVSTAAQSEVALVHNGPLLARFRIRTTMRVPAQFQFERMVRSAQLTDLVIDSLVTLRQGAERVEVRTTVHNTSLDHRLRVFLPTGAGAATFLTDGAFDVVERPVALPKDNHLNRELAVEATPQQTWCAVFDRGRGLAVISSGLLETGVRDLPERPIAITLFRSTRRTIMTDGQPDGQLQGELTSHYWIVPLGGAPDRVRLLDHGILLGAGIRTMQMTAYDVAVCPRTVTLPPAASLLRVRGAVAVTSVREVEGATEVRLFNPGVRPAAAEIDFRNRPKSCPRPRTVQRVNLESRPLEKPVKLKSARCLRRVRPKEILTLRFAHQPSPP